MEFWKNPFQVRTGSATIKVGALTLAPVAPLMLITQKSSPTGFEIGSFEVDGDAVGFFAMPSSKSCFANDQAMGELGQDGKQPLLAAFWWVAERSNKQEANMEIELKEAKGKKARKGKGKMRVESEVEAALPSLRAAVSVVGGQQPLPSKLDLVLVFLPLLTGKLLDVSTRLMHFLASKYNF